MIKNTTYVYIAYLTRNNWLSKLVGSKSTFGVFTSKLNLSNHIDKQFGSSQYVNTSTIGSDEGRYYIYTHSDTPSYILDYHRIPIDSNNHTH